MAADDNISGAGLTAKELLSEVRIDVKAIAINVNTLVGQNLDQRLRSMETWREAASIDGARMASDPMATPVGRALETGRLANASRISRLERTVWLANGAVAAIVIVAQAMPTILHFIEAMHP